MSRRIVLSTFLLLALVACGAGEAGNNQAQAPAANTEAPAAPSATTGPTNTLAPTNTPEPTNTPKPTSTPRPTRTPRPTATPEPPTATPEPIILEGSGQDVTEPFDLADGLWFASFEHTGRRNFIVRLYSDKNEDGEYVANEIGNVSNRRAVVGNPGTYFEVDADGDWTIRLEPMGFEQDAADGVEGVGTWVTGLFYPAKDGSVTYEFTHDGKRNFIVQLICKGGSDYVQNEIGAVDGAAVVRFKEGPCFWDVDADGNWTMSPR
jgi:hypothetical protein